MFTDGLPPLPLILRTMSQHFVIDVLAFNFDTYSCQLFFLLARMTCLALALFIRYSYKLSLVGDLLRTLRDLFRSKIASLHSSETHGFCGFVGLGFDFGIVWLAISESLSITKVILSMTKVILSMTKVILSRTKLLLSDKS